MNTRQRIHLNTRKHANDHKIALQRKQQRIKTLSALVDMHEALAQPDFTYLRQLKVRLRSAQNQFTAMSA